MRKLLVPSARALTWLCSGLFIAAGCSGVASSPDSEALGQRSLTLRAQPVEPPEPPDPAEPPDPPDPPEPGGHGPFDGAVVGNLPTLLSADPGDEEEPRCLCIPVFDPPGACPRRRYFCNVSGDCFCDMSFVAEGAGANSFVQVQPGDRARAPLDSSQAGQAAEKPGETSPPIADPDANAAATRVMEDLPGCICGFGTSTVPAADCPEENWYCNWSGLCRCAI